METKFSVANGRVLGARWCPSPNFNQRPQATAVSLLVIHNISLPPGQFGGGYVERFFQNQLPVDEHEFFAEIKDLQVSAHLFITRQGQVTQFVNLNDRAWHAGQSSFGGVPDCNDYSIGIELEGTDTLAYTDLQYAALTALTQAIQSAYPEIELSRITGHEHIAPIRKTDPGPAFEWDRYRSGLCDQE